MRLGFQELAETDVSVASACQPRTARPLPSLEDFAFRYGQYYDSYLATEPDREAIWAHDRGGVVAMVRVGRYVQAGGGLFAPRGNRDGLLAEVVSHCDARGDCLTFYNVTEADLPLFRRHGFQATKLGEEAVIDLDDWCCRGRSFEWLRRQVNYCRRQELRVAEYSPDEMPRRDWRRLAAEMTEISDAFLADKPQAGELRFLDGTFHPDRLGRRRLFLARTDHGRGRVEGFLVCNPYLAGSGWAFEIYRRRTDAVRGTIPFLMHEAIETLREENVRQVSLCLVPGLGAATPMPGDSAVARRALTLASRHFNFIFDTAGLYHYKSRFRPRFESRYLCARPALSLGSAWAVVRLLGVLDINPGKLARLAFKRARCWSRRQTLAMPNCDGKP